jgi:hypothetical protein
MGTREISLVSAWNVKTHSAVLETRRDRIEDEVAASAITSAADGAAASTALIASNNSICRYKTKKLIPVAGQVTGSDRQTISPVALADAPGAQARSLACDESRPLEGRPRP